ncbi:MAG: type II secretion system F family protein, partial [Candidatus Micrarchaeaceae archaeon]
MFEKKKDANAKAATAKPAPAPKPAKPVNSTTYKKPSGFKNYLEGVGAKKKGLEMALRERGVKTSLYAFVRNMLIASAMLGVVIGIVLIVLFMHIGLALEQSVVLGALLGFAIAFMAFQNFMNYPTSRGKSTSKMIERDILFAARDMIISLRSGMPLFNAITSVSTGYGDASKEFAKIVERVQLGTPLEDAIDQTVSETKSQSFRRIMLQAAVSIRAGADVVEALQSVIDQL